ncbi:MAG TPA: protein kinase [Gemmataceae bacterium]|nr:protein kinase [Gemmataceae bacterium]
MPSPSAIPDDALPSTIADRCRTAVYTYAESCRAGVAPRPEVHAEELAGAVRALAQETFADLRRRLTPPDATDESSTRIPSPGSPTCTADGTGEFTPAGGATVAEPAPPAGSRVPSVSGYAIEEMLGRGGMGVVFRATQLGLNRTVALKMILAGHLAGERQVERFRAESRAIAQLKHPNVVQVYEVGEHAGLPYFSLEYCPGGTLERLAGKEPLAPERSAALIEPLARAAAAFHAAGIIHRDLKPANVLLDADGTPKITDFGLAQNVADIGQLTATGAVLGTPSYLAPEQARGEPATPAADQYGLGATLYALLTGRPPFRGTSAIDTLEQVRTHEPVAPTQLQPGCPPDLETICLKAMSKDPAKRYPSCAAFADDLRAFLDGRPITARPVGRVEKAWRWARRNPRVAIPTGLAVAAVVAVAVLGTTFAVVFDRQKREAVQLATERQQALEQAERSAAERQAAFEQSETDRRVADESYRTAREAVVGVADRLPDLLRKNLFARQAQQQLMATLGEAVGKQADMAAARNLPARVMMNFHMKTGELAAAGGDWAKADASYAAAQELTARLLREDVTAKDRAKGNHALVLVRRGTFALNRRDKPVDVAAVMSQFGEALDLQRQVAESPTTGEIPTVEAKQSVAGTLYEIADLHRRTQKFADGVATGEESLTLRREVASAPPTPYTAGAERKLAESLVLLGKLYTALADDAKAEPYLAEAADRLAKLAAADPTDQGLQLQAARASREYGDFLIMRDRLADAAPRYTADLTLMRKILGFPELILLQSESSDVYYRTATLALKRGDQKAATADYRRCRDTRQMLADAVPANDGFQSRLANALARCGDHATAAGILEKLLIKRPDGDLFNMGCNFALCAGAVLAGRPATALTADERRLYESYRGRAVGLLERLVATGWKDSVKLATDPDLEALRDDPKFVELIARLKNPDAKRPE